MKSALSVWIAATLLAAGTSDAAAQKIVPPGGNRPLRGSLRAAQESPILVSRDLTHDCDAPACVTTALNTPEVAPPLFYDHRRLLGRLDRLELPVALCLPRADRPDDCPLGGKFPELYTSTDVSTTLQSQINFGSLRGVPGCFVLKWNADTPFERISRPFAIQAALDEDFPCQR